MTVLARHKEVHYLVFYPLNTVASVKGSIISVIKLIWPHQWMSV